MQTEYKYIRFIQTTKFKKTSVWQCRSVEDNYLLGTVKWYGAWRQYCYFTNDSIYHGGCLQDIAHFIKQLMDERKQNANI